MPTRHALATKFLTSRKIAREGNVKTQFISTLSNSSGYTGCVLNGNGDSNVHDDNQHTYVGWSATGPSYPDGDAQRQCIGIRSLCVAAPRQGFAGRPRRRTPAGAAGESLRTPRAATPYTQPPHTPPPQTPPGQRRLEKRAHAIAKLGDINGPARPDRLPDPQRRCRHIDMLDPVGG